MICGRPASRRFASGIKTARPGVSRPGAGRTRPATGEPFKKSEISQKLGNRSSEGAYRSYDLPAQGDLPAPVGVKAKTGQFPLAILGMVREDAPRSIAGHSSWQVDHQVGIFGHHLLLCSS